MGTINIAGKDRRAVVRALFGAARAQGLGLLVASQDDTLSDEECDRAWEHGVDYLRGRVMKIYRFGDEIDPRLYDRDNGEGSAEGALKRAGIL